MKTSVPSLLLSASLWLLSPSATFAGETGTQLLTDVMDKPGWWHQICMGPRPVAFDAPLPLFSSSLVTRHFVLSPDQIRRLQAARARAVPAMIEALVAMDFTRPPKETRGPESGNFENPRSGFKPDWLNPLHLGIIDELNAVETLPELLRLEAQLNGLLDAAAKDTKAPLPPLDIDSPTDFEKPGDKDQKRPDKWWLSPEHKRDEATFNARVVQREILGTITLLLHREEWPALKGRFEAEQKAGADKALAEPRRMVEEVRKTLTEAEAKGNPAAIAEARKSVDRYVNRLARLQKEFEESPYVRIDYTPALRTEIRAMADSFLATVPAEKRRAAAAMPKPEETK